VNHKIVISALAMFLIIIVGVTFWAFKAFTASEFIPFLFSFYKSFINLPLLKME